MTDFIFIIAYFLYCFLVAYIGGRWFKKKVKGRDDPLIWWPYFIHSEDPVVERAFKIRYYMSVLFIALGGIALYIAFTLWGVTLNTR